MVHIQNIKNCCICFIASYNFCFEKKINFHLKYDHHNEISKVASSTIKLIMSSFFPLKTVKLLSEIFLKKLFLFKIFACIK